MFFSNTSTIYLCNGRPINKSNIMNTLIPMHFIGCCMEFLRFPCVFNEFHRIMYFIDVPMETIRLLLDFVGFLTIEWVYYSAIAFLHVETAGKGVPISGIYYVMAPLRMKMSSMILPMKRKVCNSSSSYPLLCNGICYFRFYFFTSLHIETQTIFPSHTQDLYVTASPSTISL